MSSSLMKGSVTLTDGTTHEWVVGPRERIKAERALGIKLSDVKDGGLGEEYIAFIVYAALQRQKIIDSDVTFDTFIDDLIEDYGVDDNPESAAPPAS